MDKKLYKLYIEINVEDVSIASSIAEAQGNFRKKFPDIMPYMNERYADDYDITAVEVKTIDELPSYLLDEEVFTNDKEYACMTAREVMETFEEERRKIEATEEINRQQLKFDFYENKGVSGSI